MIRREHFRVAVPVFSGRRHEGRKTIQKLVRREVDHALGIRSRRLLLPPRPDPLPALVPRERVADALGALVTGTDDREPFAADSVDVDQVGSCSLTHVPK